MEKITEWIKNNKIKVVIIVAIIIILIIVIFGICFHNNNKIKEYEIQEVTEFLYYPTYENGKMGVIDISGKVLIEAIYDNVKIPNPTKPVFICKNGDDTIIQNENKENLFGQFEKVECIDIKGIASNMPYEKMVLKYKQNEKYGLIDYEGNKVTKPIYDEITGLENKESELLIKQNDKYGVINQRGVIIIKPQYDSIVADGYYSREAKYGLSGYIVSIKTDEGYRYGYINHKLEKILDTNFNMIRRILEIQDNENIYLIATRNGQKGVVKNGEVIINYAYQNIDYDSYNSLFILEKSSKLGAYTLDGNEIIPVEYRQINVNGIYLQAIELDDTVNYFNLKGEKIEDDKFNSVLKTGSQDYFITMDHNSKYGVINSKGEILLNNNYNYIEYLYKDYFIASNEQGNLGVINIDENIIIDFKYETLRKVNNTNVIEAKLLKENTTDLYSSELKKVYTEQDSYIYYYDNYIEAYSQEEVKYFDNNGNELEKVNENGLYAKKQGNKWGLIDDNDNVVVDFIYDRTTPLNKYGFAGIKKDDKWGVVDKNGNVILEPSYVIETNSNNKEPEFLGEYYKVYYGYGESYYTK